MKTTITFLLLAFFAIGVSAQLTLPATFENPEEDTAWTQFANAGDLPENFVLADNPDNGDINTSDFCIQFTVLEGADPWVGAWSDYYGPIEITEENHIMQMMVYKDVITPCRMKLEVGDADNYEIADTNTVTNLWELLTFDMSERIGATYTRLTWFPDFPDPREAGSTCYIDNIGFYSEQTSVKKVNNAILSVYPVPAKDVIAIKYPEMRQITITNIVGQTIKSIEFQSTSHKIVDISSLKSGVYFITLDTAGGIVSARFIKQ
jgi:hypothetical protein